MPKHAEPMPTIWTVSDDLWERIGPVFEELCPPAAVGRKRTVDFRRILEAVVFRMRSGCQWNHLPLEFGDDSSIQHWFQVWVRCGLFQRIWKELAAVSLRLCLSVKWRGAWFASSLCRLGEHAGVS